jgi:hypothetical protein
MQLQVRLVTLSGFLSPYNWHLFHGRSTEGGSHTVRHLGYTGQLWKGICDRIILLKGLGF